MMRAFSKMTWVETKLFVREPAAIFFTLAFPVMVLLLFAGIFGNEPVPGNPGLRTVDVMSPAYTGMVIATTALLGLPITLAGYRQQGILRRLRATPLHPSMLLAAQVVVNLTMTVLGIALLLLTARLVYDLRLPDAPLSVALAFMLACFSFFAFGFVLAYWFVVVRLGWPEGTRSALVYVAVAMVLWFSLVVLHPGYHMLLFVLYPQVFSLLSIRLAITFSIALTTLIVVRGLVQEPGDAFIWISSGVLSAVFGIVFGLWVDAIIRQSEERQRLVEELEATRGELASAEREAGVLEERQRVAREIHDTLAQGFVSIVTQLEAAEKDLSPEQRGVRLQLDRARHTARQGLSESRRLVQALRPELLEGASLPEALSRLAARWSEESGSVAGTTLTGTPRPLPMSTEVTLLRTAQEALSNVHKHARAGKVDLTLSYMDDLVVLDVQDDGSGFRPATPGDHNGGGFGLRAMRERAEQLGGRLLVESTAGAGTTLVVELPAGREVRKAP